jgi:hypothetical protein
MRSSLTVSISRRGSNASEASVSTGALNIQARLRRLRPRARRSPISTVNCAAAARTAFRALPTPRLRPMGRAGCVWSFTPSTSCISTATTRRPCRLLSGAARGDCAGHSAGFPSSWPPRAYGPMVGRSWVSQCFARVGGRRSRQLGSAHNGGRRRRRHSRE